MARAAAGRRATCGRRCGTAAQRHRRRRSSCRRRRSSSAGSTATSGACALPLRDGRPRSARCCVPRELAEADAAAARRSASSRRSRRCWPPRSSATELEAQVVETAALRRSDVVKTALLRAVSHDLRSPLTAIRRGGDGARLDRRSREEERARARRRDRDRGAAAVAAGRQPARPLAARGRRGRAAARTGLGGRGDRARRSTTCAAPPARSTCSSIADLPLVARRRRAARAGVREPARERRPLLGRRAGVGARARQSASACWSCDRRPRARASRRPSCERVFEPFYRAAPERRAPRLGPRAGDRARLRRGERRPDLGRVAARPGHHASCIELPLGRGARRGATRVSGPQRVLVCDDEPQILRALRVVLRDAGFEVDRRPRPPRRRSTPRRSARPTPRSSTSCCPTATAWRSAARCASGARCRSSCCRRWATRTEKVRALEAGADDYVTKPFGPRELIARLQRGAAPRRRAATDEPADRADGLEIDLAAHRCAATARRCT